MIAAGKSGLRLSGRRRKQVSEPETPTWFRKSGSKRMGWVVDLVLDDAEFDTAMEKLMNCYESIVQSAMRKYG